MPRGQYQRPLKRGPYKKENGTLIKRAIYLNAEQYQRLQDVAKSLDISYSELLRQIINKYLFQK